MKLRRALLIVLALSGMAVTGLLGRWQLHRAVYKNGVQAMMNERQALPELDGAALAPELPRERQAQLLYRRIVLRGRWLPDETIYLDNRIMDHRSGFYVVTPLRLEHSGRAVAVLRGWAIRDPADPALLPPVQTPPGDVEVAGQVLQQLPPAFALGAEGTGPIRQNLTLEEFRAQIRLPLAAVLVQQLGPPSDGLLRNWPPPTVGVQTHYSYAAQWFGLCALLGVLLLWFQVIQPLYRRR